MSSSIPFQKSARGKITSARGKSKRRAIRSASRRHLFAALEQLEDRSLMATAITSLGVSLTENFDTLAASGSTSATLPAAWAFFETGNAADQQYAIADGTGVLGGAYSFGHADSGERAFGTLSSPAASATLGTSFVNETGSDLHRLRISYTGEQWRSGGSGLADRLDFQISLDANSLTTGTWQDVDSLDFSSPLAIASAGPRDGNLPEHQTYVAATVSRFIPAGATFWLRWVDSELAGSNDGLAIDDFSLKPFGAPIDPVLSIGSVAGDPNTNVTVPLSLAVPAAEPAVGGVTSFNLLVAFDNTKLSFATATGFSTTGTATAGFTVTPNQQTNGSINTLIFNIDGGAFGVTPAIAPGTSIVLGQLTFSILPGASGAANLNILQSYSSVTTAVFDDSFSELLLIPAPTNGVDAANDGVITVIGGANSPTVNMAPAGPVLGTEDANVLFTAGNALSVSDANTTDTLTTTVSVPSTSFGTFTATNGGGTAIVTGSGTSSLTIVGSQSQVNLALESVMFIPATNRNTPADGVTTVTMSTTDGMTPDTDTFNVTLVELNDPPVPAVDSLPAVNEDAAPLVIPFATLILNDSRGAPNESSQTLTVTDVSAPIGGMVAIVGTDVVFTPTLNYSGPASFSYTAIDNGTNGGMPAPLPGSASASVSFTINSVNDVPSFLKGADQTVAFNAPAQTVTGWATAISAGGGETQGLTFIVSNNNNALFTAGGQPAVSSSGALTFTPTPGLFGTAAVSVSLMDDGGTLNGGVNTSAIQTFIITVNSPGNAPTITTIGNVTINEDASLQTVNFSGVTDGGDPVQQTITITASSNNPTVVPSPTVIYTSPSTTGSMTFTPVANANGVATITVTVRDSGLSAVDPTDDLTTITTFTVTVNAVNDRPTFTAANPPAVNEDSGAASISNFVSAFNPGPSDESTQTVLNYTVSNISNGSLFSVALSVAANGTLTYTPALNAFGTSTFDLTVTDSGGAANGGQPTSLVQTFTITVNPVNDRPTFTAANPAAVNEDAPAVNVPGFVSAFNPGPSNESAQTALSYTLVVTSNPAMFAVTPTVSPTGTLSYTLAANANGSATFDLTVTDSGGSTNGGNDTSLPQSFTITVNSVNDRPTFTAVNPPAVNEDSGAASVPGFASAFNPGPSDESTQTVLNYTVSNVTNAALFSTAPSVAANGTLTYTPALNAFGTSTFDLTVTDNGGAANGGQPTSLVQTFTITVNSVNDAPTITIGGNQTVPNGASGQTVNGFASVVSIGPANEAGQTVTAYVVSNDNNSLFSSQPSISSTGVLTYTPAVGPGGTATVTVRGQDSGGTANGGVDLSAPLTFTITVNAPLVNQPPTISPIGNVTINEDATLQTVNLSGISGGSDALPQSVTVTASSSNPSLIPNPTVNYTSPGATGSLNFTPAANGNGSAIITVTVRDSGLNLIPNDGDDLSVSTTFTVTVNAVNDQPSFTATSPAAVNEDSGAQNVPSFITGFNPGGGTDEAGQTPTYSVSAVSNPSLFSVQPTVNAAGQLSYTPAANAFGSSTFQVTANDGGGTANGGVATSAPQTFTITVNSVNDAPIFAIGPNRTTPNTAGSQSLANQTSSIAAGPANESTQTVSFLVSNNNSALFLTQPAIASNGTLTYTPAAGESGTATVTVTAQDNGGAASGGVDTSAAQTFTITIQNNNPPTINPLGNLVINQNSGVQAVNLSGITTGGETQALSVTATSSNVLLIPTPAVSYTSPNATGTLTFAPVFNQMGIVTITVNVRDAGFDGILNNADDATASTSFTVQVNDANDPPVANDKTIPAVLDTPVNSFLSATDPDGPTQTFSIVANPALGVISSFNPATGAFTYTPNPGATGLDLFTFSVTDGEFTDTGIVRITIQGPQPVVTVSGNDLLVIGTPDPDMIIITHVSAGVVRVRTDLATAYYPVSGQLIVNSGQGDDYVVANSVLVPTTLDLAEGDDYGSSGLQDDLIIGGAGNDQINASGGNNVIWGDTLGEQDLATGGHDVLSSLGGNDIVYGGGGNDQIFPGAGDDYVNAGPGSDIVSGGAGNDRIYGGLDPDQLFGDEGNDVISGGGGGDIIVGRTGSDILIGGLGSDTINGDEGSDLLFGGNTTNSASSVVGDTNDLALMAMLATWATSRPAGLASSVSSGNDGSPDQLQGYTSNDDFYISTGDSASDFGLPFMGTDRWFTV